jgi:hypothetical protein
VKTEKRAKECLFYCCCFICDEPIDRKDFGEKAVHHKSIGAVHRHHKGVEEWYKELVEKEKTGFYAGCEPFLWTRG